MHTSYLSSKTCFFVQAYELWFSTYGIEYFGLTNSTIPKMIEYNKENQILINYYYGSLNEKEITESKAVDISSLFSKMYFLIYRVSRGKQ